MARKKSRFNFRKYATLAVVVLGVIGISLTVFASQQQTSTESEATGGNYGSLINCNLKNGYAGGIQLYNGVNKTGDYRIMCIPAHYSKTHYQLFHENDLGANTGIYHDHNSIDKLNCSTYKCGGKHSNIWNFNNKTNSVKLRMNPGCDIYVYLKDFKNFEGRYTGEIGHNNWNGSKPKIISKNLSKRNRNKATSMSINVICKP